MSLSPGTRLGPYKITAPIGAGGMGDVYAADDTRLQRTVAIKVCREEFSARFEREARAIAALNHHNMCTLYDVGPHYLVWRWSTGRRSPRSLPRAPCRCSNACASPARSQTPPAYLTARPVSDEVFQLYENVYAYEPKDLAAKLESVDESSELWRREKVSFDAGYGGERVLAHLFMPRHATGPVACVVVMPSGSTVLAKGTSDSIRPESYILRSGRAMLYPVFKGTYERYASHTYQPVEIS